VKGKTYSSFKARNRQSSLLSNPSMMLLIHSGACEFLIEYIARKGKPRASESYQLASQRANTRYGFTDIDPATDALRPQDSPRPYGRGVVFQELSRSCGVGRRQHCDSMKT